MEYFDKMEQAVFRKMFYFSKCTENFISVIFAFKKIMYL